MDANKRILALTLCLAIAAGCVAGAVGLSTFAGATLRSREEAVIRTLGRYKERGLFVDDVMGDPTDSYMLPINIDYPYNPTQQQLTDAFQRQQEKLKDLKELPPNEFLAAMIEVAVKGTRFEERIRINEIPTNDHLNIYFLSYDPERLVHGFHNNCSYIGLCNAIICDAKYLKTMLAEIEKETVGLGIEEKGARGLAKLNKMSFMYWIIAHEAGHAICHHKSIVEDERPAHFYGSEVEHREIEADQFVCNGLIQNLNWAGAFANSINLLLEREYVREIEEEWGEPLSHHVPAEMKGWDLYKIVEGTPIVVEDRNSLVVRLTRILCTLVSTKRGIDDSGHYHRVRSNLSIVNAWQWTTGLSISFVCLVTVALLLQVYLQKRGVLR